ncbi:MAG: ABC transporter permease [Oscillospiraceae bacterium]
MEGFFTQIADLLFTTTFAASIFRVTTPILFAALGGLVARRAGIMNLALEGMMLTSALTGVVVSAYVKKAALGGVVASDALYGELIGKANLYGTLSGFLAGTLSAILLALFLAYMAVQLNANIYLSGLAINTMAAGGTVFVLYLAAGEKGISSSLNSCTMPVINIPIIKDIPVLGEIVSGHSLMVYFALLCIPLVYFIIMKTSTGLRIRAVGENAHAAESVGVNVKRVQFQAMALSGLFCGFGGISLSMSYVSFFSRNMTAGKGFIGMSAMNLGNASPIGTTIAAFLFGMFDAMANVLQALAIPNQFVVSIPYIATLVGLVVFAIQSENKVKKLKKKQ